MKKALARIMNGSYGGGLFTATAKPKQINPESLNIGDEVVLWNTDDLTETDIVKGGKYTVNYIHAGKTEITVDGVQRWWQFDDGKKEVCWELWRFCRPEDYNESGMYFTPAYYESCPVTEFAGRKIISRLNFPIESFGIPFKKLKRVLFAEVFHPQFIAQYMISGDSRLYLASFGEYWLLLQWQKCDLTCELEYVHTEFSIALMMKKEKGDTKSSVAKLLFALWVYHFPYSFQENTKYQLHDVKRDYIFSNSGRKRAEFITQDDLQDITQRLDKKTYKQASDIIKKMINKF